MSPAAPAMLTPVVGRAAAPVPDPPAPPPAPAPDPPAPAPGPPAPLPGTFGTGSPSTLPSSSPGAASMGSPGAVGVGVGIPSPSTSPEGVGLGSSGLGSGVGPGSSVGLGSGVEVGSSVGSGVGTERSGTITTIRISCDVPPVSVSATAGAAALKAMVKLAAVAAMARPRPGRTRRSAGATGLHLVRDLDVSADHSGIRRLLASSAMCRLTCGDIAGVRSRSGSRSGARSRARPLRTWGGTRPSRTGDDGVARLVHATAGDGGEGGRRRCSPRATRVRSAASGAGAVAGRGLSCRRLQARP